MLRGFWFRRGAAFGVLTALALLLPACSNGPDGGRLPDLVLISIDTMRADHLGCYGYTVAHTPHIDALADAGVLYEQCQSPVPITLPSHATMLTGLLPPRHGVRNNATYRLSEEIPTLAEKLREAGYVTGAFVGALPLARRFGLDRGFDAYEDGLPDRADSQFAFRERSAQEVVSQALDWVDRQSPRQPVFLFIHFFEPHIPYEPTPPYDGMFAAQPYDGEVAVADEAVGDLLAMLDERRGKNRLTVLTGDHGEGLGEHGESTHALFLYQTTLHVPLILHGPNRWPQGRRIAQPVSLCDIAPTLLANLDGPERPVLDADGIVLDPAGDEPPLRPLYAETLYPLENFSWSPAFALRSGREKVIRSRRPHAFDLQTDPGETRDLLAVNAGPDSGENAQRVEYLLNSLDRTLARLTAASLQGSSGRKPDREELAALKSLGYVGGSSHASTPQAVDSLLAAVASRPDAGERLPELETTKRADELIAAGREEEAVDLLKGLLQDSPDNTWTRILLAQTQKDLGLVEDALANYELANASRPDWLEIQISRARLHDQLEHPAESAEAYAQALALDPGDVKVRLEAAGTLQRMGESAVARQVLHDGLDRSGSSVADRAEIRWALALSHFYAREFDESREQLTALRELEGESARLLAFEGDLLYRLGDRDGAVASLQRAVVKADTLATAQNSLAWLLATWGGDPAAALSHAERAIALRPEEAEFHDTYLEVLIRLGRDAEARDHLQAILPHFPGNEALVERERSLSQQR